MSEEKILCIRRSLFDRVGAFQGIRIGTEPILAAMNFSKDVLFHPRAAAEKDRSLKQIIPYILVVYGDQVLRYRRDKNGERRLEGYYSIGLGGHINSDDGAIHECYFNAVARELHEEMGLSITNHALLPRPVVLINDDATEVGAVHLGFVHVVRLSSPHGIDVPRCELHRPEWVHRNELLKEGINAYEPWSRICLSELSLLLCQKARRNDGPPIAIEIVRESDTPGFYICRTHDGVKFNVSRSQLV